MNYNTLIKPVFNVQVLSLFRPSISVDVWNRSGTHFEVSVPASPLIIIVNQSMRSRQPLMLLLLLTFGLNRHLYFQGESAMIMNRRRCQKLFKARSHRTK